MLTAGAAPDGTARCLPKRSQSANDGNRFSPILSKRSPILLRPYLEKLKPDPQQPRELVELVEQQRSRISASWTSNVRSLAPDSSAASSAQPRSAKY